MSPCDSPVNAHILQMSSCLNSQPVMFYHHSLTSKMLLVLLLITKAIHVKCRNFGTRTKKKQTYKWKNYNSFTQTNHY